MNNDIGRTRGFTLLELMIALAVVGVLTAIAYPSYKMSMLKSHRTDAMAALAQDQSILERCYAQNFSYAGCASLPAFPHNSTQSYYSISLSNLSASTYLLTATATTTGNQNEDTTCATLSVDQANQKTAQDNAGTAQTSCWGL